MDSLWNVYVTWQEHTVKTYLVDENELETIVYNPEEQQDLFADESVVLAANKVLDFDEFKKQWEIENAKTIDNVDDLNLDDVLDNKNLIISSKKIRDKYWKIRKRKAANQEKKIKQTIERFNLPLKKSKRQVDKAALLAPKNISKKYKNIRFREMEDDKKI